MDKDILDALKSDVELLAELHGVDVVAGVLTALAALARLKEREDLQRVGRVTFEETIHLGNATVKVVGNPWEGKLEITVMLPTGPKNA